MLLLLLPSAISLILASRQIVAALISGVRGSYFIVKFSTIRIGNILMRLRRPQSVWRTKNGGLTLDNAIIVAVNARAEHRFTRFSMPQPEFLIVDVAVALIWNAKTQQLLWTWNERWCEFSLPAKRIRLRPGTRLETATRLAAERAAAEALGVPVEVRFVVQADPILERSGSDARTKSYRYSVHRATAQPRFEHNIALPPRHIWLAAHEVLSGDYRPLSATTVRLVAQLTQLKWWPGRQQVSSTVVITRIRGGQVQFLLRHNPDWGYSLPSKRGDSGETPGDVAARVLSDELGLQAEKTARLASAASVPVTYHEQSDSTDVPTYYVHHVFEATLENGARLVSDQPLIWAARKRRSKPAKPRPPKTWPEQEPPAPAPCRARCAAFSKSCTTCEMRTRPWKRSVRTSRPATRTRQ